MTFKYLVKAALAKSVIERRQHLASFRLTRSFGARKEIWNKHCAGFAGRNCYDSNWKNYNSKSENLKSYCENDFIVFRGAAKKLVSDVMQNIDLAKTPSDAHGRIKIVLNDLQMSRFFASLDKDVLRFMTELYGRDFWFREAPFLMIHPPAKAKNHVQSKWHIDGFNQVTITVLCEDNWDNGTATQFLSGSGQEDWSFDRDDNELPENKYDVHTCSGKAGDVFVINAGQALHRSMVANGRKAIFINFSSGVYEKKMFGI